MYRLILAAALSLAACGGPAPVGGTTAFRDTAAPIYSAAAFDPARLDGRWVEVAGYAPQGATCRAGGVEFGAGGTTAVARLCLAGQDRRLSGPVVPAGPGRLTVDGTLWWVLWVDSGYRTLAIGTPSGAFGFVLNRDGPIPPDRLAAAREVMSFNGYNPAGLRNR